MFLFLCVQKPGDAFAPTLDEENHGEKEKKETCTVFTHKNEHTNTQTQNTHIITPTHTLLHQHTTHTILHKHTFAHEVKMAVHNV